MSGKGIQMQCNKCPQEIRVRNLCALRSVL